MATFLKAHWGAIAAMDFFKVEVMTLTGPVRYSVLVVMDLKTRHVEVAGIVREAYEEWMLQVLRNLTDAVDGFLLGKTHLIMDRDPVFNCRRSGHAQAHRNETCSPAASQPQPERVHRTLHPLDQGGLSRPRHPAR